MACGLLFDGIHRNIEKDTPEHRLSNIARLFRAFPDERENIPNVTYNAFYISGLGTPFNETVVEKLHTIMDSGLDSITDDITSQPGEMTKEAGMDFIKGDSWYEVLKKQGKKLLNPAEWKNLAFDTAKNAVKKVSIESTPWLRDNPTVADMLVTGVDTRITSTKLTFQEGYKEAIKKARFPSS